MRSWQRRAESDYWAGLTTLEQRREALATEQRRALDSADYWAGKMAEYSGEEIAARRAGDLGSAEQFKRSADKAEIYARNARRIAAEYADEIAAL